MARVQDLLLAYDDDFVGFVGGGNAPRRAPAAAPAPLSDYPPSDDPDGYYTDFSARLAKFVHDHPRLGGFEAPVAHTEARAAARVEAAAAGTRLGDFVIPRNGGADGGCNGGRNGGADEKTDPGYYSDPESEWSEDGWGSVGSAACTAKGRSPASGSMDETDLEIMPFVTIGLPAADLAAPPPSPPPSPPPPSPRPTSIFQHTVDTVARRGDTFGETRAR